jgi:hypothetical protein
MTDILLIPQCEFCLDKYRNCVLRSKKDKYRWMPQIGPRADEHVIFFVSAVAFAGGLILSPITGFGSFAITLAGWGLFVSSLAEDNEVFADDINARRELHNLIKEIEELEKTVRKFL